MKCKKQWSPFSQLRLHVLPFLSTAKYNISKSQVNYTVLSSSHDSRNLFERAISAISDAVTKTRECTCDCPPTPLSSELAA